MTTRVLRGDHCQCSGCSEYFNSTRAFDKHRREDDTGIRRCLTEAEMLKAGMARNATGWWVSAALKMAPAYLYRNSVGGDQDEETSACS